MNNVRVDVDRYRDPPCQRCADYIWDKKYQLHTPSVCFANTFCKGYCGGLLELFIENNEHFKGMDINE